MLLRGVGGGKGGWTGQGSGSPRFFPGEGDGFSDSRATIKAISSPWAFSSVPFHPPVCSDFVPEREGWCRKPAWAPPSCCSRCPVCRHVPGPVPGSLISHPPASYDGTVGAKTARTRCGMGVLVSSSQQPCKLDAAVLRVLSMGTVGTERLRNLLKVTQEAAELEFEPRQDLRSAPKRCLPTLLPPLHPRKWRLHR